MFRGIRTVAVAASLLAAASLVIHADVPPQSETAQFSSSLPTSSSPKAAMSTPSTPITVC